ncbi:MAG TPA: cyclophilin-like fold protein [Coprobacillaceae bacterium]|nr:cyclophilin-like fold protein [Coprobacillaceae bacterium]
MKKFILLILVIVGLCLFINKPIYQKNIKKEESEAMLLEVNGYTFEVELENNTSAKALREYVSKEKRTLSLDDYGNFEKVGDLGITLPRNDETITTKEGDLILYLGNKLCLYYNQNTWDFTKLGHIKDTTHLKEVLGKGSVRVTLLME